MTVDLTDEDGTFTSAGTTTAVLTNTPPAVVGAAEQTLFEGRPPAAGYLNLGGFLDRVGSNDGPFIVVIDWGDGTTDTSVNAVPIAFDTPSGIAGTHVYADSGVYTVGLSVTAADGTGGFDVTHLRVLNVAPTVRLTAPTAGSEGSPVLLAGSFADPGTADGPYSVTVSWGDGGTDTFAVAAPGPLPARPHTYADDGPYTVSVRVTDKDGGSGVATTSVSVANVAPTVALAGGPAVAEGSAYTLSVGAVADPGADTVSQYRVNWGDGTSDTYTAGGVKAHAYADDGTYAVSVDLTDEDGTVRNRGGVVTASVFNAAPAAVLSGPAVGNEGTAVTFAGSFTDPGTADGPFAYAWAVTAPNGVSVPGASGTVPSSGGVPSFSFTPPDDGTYTVSLTVTDKDGAPNTVTRTLAVGNVAPTLVAYSTPAAGTAGQPVALSAAATDPAGRLDPLTYSWTVLKEGTPFAAGTGPTFAFTPDAAGNYAVALRVDDGDGGVATLSTVVSVTDAPPVVTPPTPLPAAPYRPKVVTAIGTAVSVFDPLTGTTATLTPYPAYSGTVTVATADLDGDGYADIVTAAGPGGGPHVKVFDGRTMAEVASFYAYAPYFTGGVFVAATGRTTAADGRVVGGRIVTGAGAGGGPHVKVIPFANVGQVYTDAPLAGEVRDDALLASFYAFDEAFTGGVRVAAGDLDGDGVPEVAAVSGPGMRPQVKVFDGTTFAPHLFAGLPYFTPFLAPFDGGAFVAVGGGKIAVGADGGGGPNVKLFSPAGAEEQSVYAADESTTSGARVGFADVDGDGTVELLAVGGAVVLPGDRPRVRAYSLNPFALLSDAPADPLGVYVS